MGGLILQRLASVANMSNGSEVTQFVREDTKSGHIDSLIGSGRVHISALKCVIGLFIASSCCSFKSKADGYPAKCFFYIKQMPVLDFRAALRAAAPLPCPALLCNLYRLLLLCILNTPAQLGRIYLLA